MNYEKREKWYGKNVYEYFESIQNEILVDAIGLHAIVGIGCDGFDFIEDELKQFVKECILHLLEKNAKPIWGKKKYSGTSVEITDIIIKDWLELKREPNFDDVWFALPHIYE